MGMIMGKRRILLDTRKVSSIEGSVTQQFWPAEKHGSPVLVGDKPWERFGVSIFGNVHQDQGRFRMWYMAWPEVPPRSNSSYVAYAESIDGIQWEKPELAIEPFAGSDRLYSATNLVNLVRTVPSVIIDPDEPDPTQRYKAGGYVGAARVLEERGKVYPGSGFYLAHSPDGLRWQDYPAEGPVGTPYDVGTFIRDVPRQRYLGTAKQIIRYNLLDRRSISVMSSQDCQQWTQPATILVADAVDDRIARDGGFHHAEFYGMGMEAYDDFLVGFVWVYWAALPLRPGYRHGMWGQMDCQLVYSYDGSYWFRTPNRQPFIPFGQKGDFDASQIITASRPVVVGDEVRLYYTGYAHEHAFYFDKQWQRRTDLDWDHPTQWNEHSISFARIKQDRYASLSTSSQGSFMVAHGPLDGNRLLVNARAPHGSVKARLLQADGSPIPGYGLDECQGFSGDHTGGELQWRGSPQVDLPLGQALTIQFVLDNADLFAYEFA
ncbi:MAG: hypothetical protein EXR62_03600 [Chloroflexi bacterium]|nr:hypothetical protein [Chloroflexota bacterium]